MTLLMKNARERELLFPLLHTAAAYLSLRDEAPGPNHELEDKVAESLDPPRPPPPRRYCSLIFGRDDQMKRIL